MKKYLILFFGFFATLSLNAQLEKGDWLIDFSSRLSISNEVNSDFSFVSGGISPTAGYMMTDNIMAGMGVGFSGGNTFSANSHFSGYGVYEVSPFVRYYLPLKPRIMAFGFLDAYLLNRTNDNNFQNSRSSTAYSGKTGLGVDIFVAPNLAMELTAGALLLEGGDFDLDAQNTNRLFLKLNFRTFLHDRINEKFDLKEKNLKKGNYILNGFGSFTPYDGVRLGNAISFLNPETIERTGHQFNIESDLSYFKSDTWIVGGGVRMSYLSSSNDHSISAGLNFNSRYFIPVSDRLYLVPSGTIGYSRSTTEATYYHYTYADGSEIECGFPATGAIFLRDSSYTKKHANFISGNVELVFNYFTKGNSLLKGGLSYSHVTRFFDGEKSNIRDIFSPFLGLEYFFASNLALNATMRFDLNQSKIVCSSNGDIVNTFHIGGLYMGLTYVLFNKFKPVKVN